MFQRAPRVPSILDDDQAEGAGVEAQDVVYTPSWVPDSGNPYRASLQDPISQITNTPQVLLSRRITAYMVGIKDAKTVSRWIN